MKINKMVKISGMILLAIAVSLIMLALIHILQTSLLAPALVTVSWNG